MQTIKALCKPRDSVFADTARDDMLNLSDLIENKIDADKFFAENFKTKGMELLLETAFKRFAGKSETGVIKLTQAMGGGKTHNMLALALLTQNPKWRRSFLGSEYDDVGEVNPTFALLPLLPWQISLLPSAKGSSPMFAWYSLTCAKPYVSPCVKTRWLNGSK